MSTARYLVRFDDICPGMNWNVWAQVESLLKARRIRPLLAVVPDNRDPKLAIDAVREDFWERVRMWQSWGWSIGLHGYQHLYATRSRGLLGLNASSEFAGLPAPEQAAKLDAAMEIFHRERVRIDCWIAPGHSFDSRTVELLRERGVTTLSDGYFCHPVRWMGCIWIPQQLWRFRAMPGGVWTICFHHNHFSPDHLRQFEADLAEYSERISSLEEVLRGPVRDRSLADSCIATAWLMALRMRRALDALGS